MPRHSLKPPQTSARLAHHIRAQIPHARESLHTAAVYTIIIFSRFLCKRASRERDKSRRLNETYPRARNKSSPRCSVAQFLCPPEKEREERERERKHDAARVTPRPNIGLRGKKDERWCRAVFARLSVLRKKRARAYEEVVSDCSRLDEGRNIPCFGACSFVDYVRLRRRWRDRGFERMGWGVRFCLAGGWNE